MFATLVDAYDSPSQPRVPQLPPRSDAFFLFITKLAMNNIPEFLIPTTASMTVP